MNHILARIGGYRFAGSSGCQVPRRFLLPAFVLAANLGDFDAAVAFMDGTERGARFDRLELLWIADRSEEHTSELQSLMRISYAVFCLNKQQVNTHTSNTHI